MGQLANAVRADVESAIEQQSAVLAEKALEERLEAEALDITVPGKAHKLGHKHPMYTALDEIKEIFISMGFTVLDGPEVELATYNFDKLNAGEGHPSRDLSLIHIYTAWVMRYWISWDTMAGGVWPRIRMGA